MPDINNVSGTAFIIAEFRAEENESAEPLYQDEIVKLFLDRETQQVAQRVAQSFPAVKDLVKLRTRYFDDVLAQQLALGCQQVVILGSGLDTRAVRMAISGVRYFEIDQAATLQLKAERLAANGIAAQVTYIPGDYVKDDLMGLLESSHFNAQLPTYFLWEGNVTYLKKGEIIAVLDVIRNRVRQFELSLDYMSDQVINKTTGYAELDDYMEQLERRGASWITGFKDMNCFTRNLGLNIIETYSAAQLHERYRPQIPLPSFIFQFYFVCTIRRA